MRFERRGASPMTNEADLSLSLTPAWLTEDATRDHSNRSLGRAERADHDVIPVRIAKCIFHGTGTRVQVRLFL
jgi:hypothetical protein